MVINKENDSLKITNIMKEYIYLTIRKKKGKKTTVLGIKSKILFASRKRK